MRRMDSRRLTTSERFWSRVSPEPNTGCWYWTGCANRNGYGEVRAGGVRVLAHRFAWEDTNGPLRKGDRVLHRCDVPGCVNPGHLFTGSQADNARDMAMKGRQVYQRSPEKAPRGNLHYSRLRPDRLARGDRNGSRLFPERLARGERHPNACLTAPEVRTIRDRAASGEGSAAIARAFGITKAAVYLIVTRRNWKHVA